MKQEEIDAWIERINDMSHEQMCYLWRFSPSGHPIFDSSLSLFEIFNEKFQQLGGMTTEISKKIGW